MIVDDEDMLKSVFANERHKRKNENSNKNMILNMSYRNIRVMVNKLLTYSCLFGPH